MQGQRWPKLQRLPRSQKRPTATVLVIVEVLEEVAEVPEAAGVPEVTELPRGTATPSVIFGGPMQKPVFFADFLSNSRGQPAEQPNTLLGAVER